MHCSSMVAAAEDAVLAMMEYLVAPMLPVKSFGRDPPSLSLQESVAKQVHAIVLLYNYYYRKQHPQVEFLGFKSFCQLAVIVKPTLMGHMKLMHHADFTELDDVENQLSMTEKAIMNACDITSALDPSQNTPSTESWEVCKVAVLLTDSSKEKCLLQFSSITQGVWSVIEKDVPGARCDGKEGRQTNKRKRNNKKNHGDGVNIDEANFQQLALSAVTETTGINQGDLVVLESRAVYSLSREKSAVQFYIVQSIISIDDELMLSIKNIIESLQGPLVKKRNCSWAVTPVVEYFHMLPYAGVIEEWFSREVISNNPQDLMLGMEKVDVESLQKVDYSFGNEDRDDSKSKIILLHCADVVSHGTDNTKYSKHENDIGTRGVALQDVNIKNSQKTSNLSVKVHDMNEADCGKDIDNTNFVSNGCGCDHSEVSAKGNDIGSVKVCRYDSLGGSQKIGVTDCSTVYCPKAGEVGNFDVKGCQMIDNLSDEKVLEQKTDNGGVTGCQVDSLGGSQNMDITDCSMVYCIRAGESSNVDYKSCQIIDNLFDEEVSIGKLSSKKTSATDTNANKMTGINDESSTQITNIGFCLSGLPDCQTDQQPMNTDDTSMIDEVCKYGMKCNKKTATDSDENKQSETNVEFSRQITDNGNDLNLSGTDVEFSRQITDNETDLNQSGTNVELSRQRTYNGTDLTDFADCHATQQNLDGIYVESSKPITHNGLRDCDTDKQTMDTDDSMIDEVCKYGLKHNKKTNTDSNENKQSGTDIEFSKQRTDNGTEFSSLPDCRTTQQKMDRDDSFIIQHQNGNKLSNGCTITEVYSRKKRMGSSNSNKDGKTGGVKIEIDDSMPNTFVPKLKDGKTDKGKETWSITCSDQGEPVIGDQAVVPYQLNAEYRDKLQVTRVLEQDALSQTALTYLRRKKSKLAHQLRLLEDEIAVCDKNIQTLLDGGETELTMQVEAIVDACYDVSLKGEAETQEWACQLFGTQVSAQVRKKSLSDANIPSWNSCQELDDISHRNCWTLPTYQLYPVNGGFSASIKLKGTDFEYSEEGESCVKPSLARESAAGKMIAKLQRMAGQKN